MHRILYICHDGALYGSQRSLLTLIQQLPDYDYGVFVSVARSGPFLPLLETLPSVTLFSHRRLQWFKHDHRSWFKRIGDILLLLLLALPRAIPLAMTIRRHKISLVHTNSVVSLEGALAARLAGVPHVWHIREMFMTDNPKLFPVLGKRLSRVIIRMLSARVISISNAVQKQFVSTAFASQKYPVIYNAVSKVPHGRRNNQPTYRRQNRGRDELQKLFLVGYIGRLSEGKRFHDLLHAFQMLLDTQPQSHLLVVGDFVDEPYEAMIRDRIHTLNLSEQITFLPFQNDLGEVFASLDVLVLPSFNEPFGRILIEAMQAGVLCIGANSGGIPEIITDNVTGLLYPPGDLAALALALDKAASRPLLMHDIRENALRMLDDRFTLNNHMEMITKCYQRLLTPQAPNQPHPGV